MNERDLRAIFGNASPAFIAENCGAKNPGKAPKLERDPGDAALGAAQVQGGSTSLILVRVTSVRSRLLDPDNICEKYAIDGCRYAGLLPGDSPEEITLQTDQRKRRKGEEEHTEITITYPHQPNP